MHHFITGAAGFIGSHLADSLLQRGDRVSGVDDFSLGRPENLALARQSKSFAFYEADISRASDAMDCLRAASEWGGAPDIVWHLAANSDIAAGTADASIDFRRTLQTTFAVLEAAKSERITRIAFASSSAIYGELEQSLAEEFRSIAPGLQLWRDQACQRGLAQRRLRKLSGADLDLPLPQCRWSACHPWCDLRFRRPVGDQARKPQGLG